jgi:hypothetical protein
MQLKFVECTNLEELESTANFLLLEGWERDSVVQFLNGKYLMTFQRWTPHNARHGITPLGSLEISTACEPTREPSRDQPTACGRGTS